MNTNPEQIAQAIREKTVMVDWSGTGRKKKTQKYEHVEIQEV